MLLVRNCENPCGKMFNRSHDMLENPSTSHFINNTKLNSSSQLGSCISFEEQCISLNLGSHTILVMFLVTTCKNPHSKIPQGSLTILKCVSTCHNKKIMRWVPLVSFPWHGLGNLIIIFTLFDIFRWGLLQFANWKLAKIKYGPKFPWHTLISKRNTVFEQGAWFVLVIMRFELFRDLQKMSSTQTF